MILISTSEDIITIGTSLVLCTIFILVSVTIVRINTRTATKSTMELATAELVADYPELLAMDGKEVSGTEVVHVIDKYMRRIPILLVTGELYDSGVGFTYDLSHVHDEKAAEYVNTGKKFACSVTSEGKEQIRCIRFVQSEYVRSPGLATYESTLDSLESSQQLWNTLDDVIKKQLKLYQLQQ